MTLILSLARGGYPASTVRAALHMLTGTMKTTYKFELLDALNNPKRQLTNVLAASVSHNAARAIKRTARFTLLDDGTVDFLADRIKPYVCVWMPPRQIIRQYYYLSPWQWTERQLQWVDWDKVPASGGWVEFPLGVFLLSTPPRRIDGSGTVTREVEAYDLGQILVDAKTTDRYFLPAGMRYIDAITNGLLNAGIAQHNITPTDLVLPFDREWAPGTPYGKIVNDLLAAINYRSIWFDEEGVAMGIPYVLPDRAPSTYTYADDHESVILPDAEQALDLFNVPNQWVLYTSPTDGAPLRSVYTNTNPNSPTSTASRGRTITAPPMQVDAADQTTLDAIALRMAFEASQVYETVNFQTAVMPFHSHADVFTLQYSGLGVSAKYEEIGWEFDLSVTAVMRHEVRRLVTV